MEKFRLKNYRCFSDTEDICINKLNFFVGANSSGKSSIMKILPLIKQSMGIRLNGTFFWGGDDVDFKDFSNTLKTGTHVMSFECNFDEFYTMPKRRRNGKRHINNVHISFTVEQAGEHFDRMTSLKINFDDDTEVFIDMSASSKTTITVNGIDYIDNNSEKLVRMRTNALFDSFVVQPKESDEHPWLRERIFELGREMTGRNLLPFPLMDSFPMNYDTFKNRLFRINETLQDGQLQELYGMMMLYSIDALIDSLNYNFFLLAEGVHYVKPVRATFERFYRYKNIDLDNINSDGSNLPMYFYNLPEDVRDTFTKWLYDFMGFKLIIKPHEGHIELQIEEKGKGVKSLVDVGAGYNQMLPILGIIWETIFIHAGNNKNANKLQKKQIIVIEQPELHLHPNYQKKFINMVILMLTVCEKMGLNVRFMIETHSETILNEVGYFISSNPDFKHEVNVFLVSQDKQGNSTVSKTNYTDEGYLESWPVNFFNDAD